MAEAVTTSAVETGAADGASGSVDTGAGVAGAGIAAAGTAQDQTTSAFAGKVLPIAGLIVGLAGLGAILTFLVKRRRDVNE